MPKFAAQVYLSREWLTDVGEDQARRLLLADLNRQARAAGWAPLDGTEHWQLLDPNDPSQVLWQHPDTPENMLVAHAWVHVVSAVTLC